MIAHRVVPPYRLTPEDVPDLDKKTSAALEPLFAALNTTLPPLVQAVAAASSQFVSVNLAVGAVVADSFPILFRHGLPRVVSVRLDNVQPNDPNHVLTAPWVMQGWGLTDDGLVLVPYVTGLLASNSYLLSFEVRS